MEGVGGGGERVEVRGWVCGRVGGGGGGAEGGEHGA